MTKLGTLKFYSILLVVFLIGVLSDTAQAQLEEPTVEKIIKPKTAYSEGFRNSVGFDVLVNNFGFGIGGTYGRVVAPYTEIFFRTGITGIRDASEQTFQSFLTGQQIIPNKYNRAFGFPFLLGLKQRLFAEQIDDNLRFFVSGALGPSLAYTYPYLQDLEDPFTGEPNGFRDFILTDQGFLIPDERINDFFSGWSDGESHWGYNGEIKLGVDLGSKFKSRTTIEFGYFFYYFKEGLQIMEPYRPTEYNQFGEPVFETREEFFKAQKYFGTPQIKFTFGGMW